MKYFLPEADENNKNPFNINKNNVFNIRQIQQRFIGRRSMWGVVEL